MLNRQLLAYLPVYLAQALMGFGGVVVFTRMLSPAQYGEYTLILAATGLIQTAGFTWLDAALARFHARADARGRLGGHLATAWRLFAIMAVSVGLSLAVLILVLPDAPGLKAAAAFGLAALIIRAAVTICLVTRRAAGEIGRYSLLESVHLAGGFALGVVFISAGGLGQAGPFAGMAAAGLLVCLIDVPVLLSRSRRDRADKPRSVSFLAYGAPVAFSLIFESLLSVGDRFVIAGFLGEAATGAYAAGYGITDRSLDIIFIWLGAATGPLAVAAFEHEGRKAAQLIAKQGAALMGLIGIPAALGLALVSQPLAAVLIAPAMVAEAAAIMPLIALGSLMNGIMIYFFHEAFVLGRKPGQMATIMTASAVFNLALNVVLVPVMGLTGAALATVIAYGAALTASAIIGYRAFPLTLPLTDWAKALLGASLMGIVLVRLPELDSAFLTLVMKIGTGGLVYVLAALTLNIAGCRAWVRLPQRLQPGKAVS